MAILEPEGYARARALVDASGQHSHLSFAYAVLEGRQPGFVSVDQADCPASAIICNYSGFFLTFGPANAALAEATLAELPNHPVDFLFSGIFTSTPAWVDVLADLLPGAPRADRKGFRWQPEPGRPPVDWQARIPPDLALAPISAELAQTIMDGSCTQDFGIDPWFVRISGGPQAYAALGLGLALVERASHTIASLCGVCALGNGEAEMEVGTTPAFRGRGLASLVSAAFLEQAQANRWQPAYTCASDNLPSISVAHKLGFVEVEEIPGFQIT